MHNNSKWVKRCLVCRKPIKPNPNRYTCSPKCAENWIRECQFIYTSWHIPHSDNLYYFDALDLNRFKNRGRHDWISNHTGHLSTHKPYSSTRGNKREVSQMIKHREGCKRRPCNCGFAKQLEESAKEDRKQFPKPTPKLAKSKP